MAIDISALRSALAVDPAFIGRLSAIMSKIAVQVINEAGGTANHAARLAYATKVILNPNYEATRAVMFVLFTDNFVGATIDIVPEGGGRFSARCSTADADADSQIANKWDQLAVLFG